MTKLSLGQGIAQGPLLLIKVHLLVHPVQSFFPLGRSLVIAEWLTFQIECFAIEAHLFVVAIGADVGVSEEQFH